MVNLAVIKNCAQIIRFETVMDGAATVPIWLRSVGGVRRSRVGCLCGVVLFFLFLQSQKLDQFRIPIRVMLMLGVLVLLMIFLHMFFVLLLIQLVLVFR